MAAPGSAADPFYTSPPTGPTASEGSGSGTVGTSSAILVAANTARREVTITNDSDTAIYLALGEDAVLNKGIRLNGAGGSYTTDKFTGAVHAICSLASKTATFVDL